MSSILFLFTLILTTENNGVDRDFENTNMFTLFFIIFISYLIYKVLSGNKTEERDSNYYDEHPELNFSKKFYGKELTTTEKFLNLGITDSSQLKYFSYNNRQIEIVMKDGKKLNGNLENLKADFSILQGDNISCRVSHGNTSIKIFSVWHLLKEEEWYELFNILTHCGEVKNLSEYTALYNKTHTKLGKGLSYANTALKVIKHFQ